MGFVESEVRAFLPYMGDCFNPVVILVSVKMGVGFRNDAIGEASNLGIFGLYILTDV